MPSVESKNARGVEESERIVISGMAGLFPDCRNIKELSDILYNKVYPISPDNGRWKYNHPEINQYLGKVPEIDLFDAQFFMVHYRLCHRMDAMARKVLEQAYQAIYDAGVSPEHLNGKKIGVYLGCSFSESDATAVSDNSSRNGFGLTGCSKSMFANRISYWLNAKGPSVNIDQACCSSLAALEAGYQAILRGECEAALVTGSNLCLLPQSMVQYSRLMNLSPDGKVRSFDSNANGCVRSEAINVLFLQKAKDALRIYAEVVYVKSKFTSLVDGDMGPKYGFYRNPSDTITFLNEFYDEVKVNPRTVNYIEAFGSGIADVDKSELEALGEVFCKGRNKPLLVGSVTSNIGYCENASGICAIAKVLLGYNSGKVAANLHCKSPRQDVDFLKSGHMEIVTEHQPMNYSYVAVNSYSYTGVNAHVLLKGHDKIKDLSRYKSNIPHLVTISGRQEASVNYILQDLKSRRVDPEELALLHNIHEKRISGHLGRGYIILDTNEETETVSLSEQQAYFDDAKRPLWFVYSGMGSQWAGMGAQFMQIPIFAAAIEKCRAVLEPRGVDIINIITSTEPNIFDSILNSFVGIAAIQIGLTDILKELEIIPDKIIGHSVGELGCAYADGCLSAEEMILASYSRGLVSIQTPFIFGSMAAIGLGCQEISKLVPPGIEVACHNSATSSTISGPADLMEKFISEIQFSGTFAKIVPCSNIAYHSSYIAQAGPSLLKNLKEIIKEPRLRTDRWVSTSVPQDKWHELDAIYSSAEYHTNNLLKPVLFEETSKLIPPNAVLIEIAPHGLLQAILKRSLPISCTNIPLTRRGSSDNIRFLLEAIGELFMVGFNPTVKALYPKIEFPVSNGTSMLSHLVEWARNETWQVPLFIPSHKKVAAACNFVISVHDDAYSYLKGHIIRGMTERVINVTNIIRKLRTAKLSGVTRVIFIGFIEKNVYPFASALVAVWDTLAMSLEIKRKSIAVHFSDVHFYSQPCLDTRRRLKLSIGIQRGSGRFEVMDDKTKVISGFIQIKREKEMEPINNDISNKEQTVNNDDIYKLLYLKDYNYVGDFRSIHNATVSFTTAKILWYDSWETFIDGILQFNFLRNLHDTTCQLRFIKNIEIDVNNHMNYAGELENGLKLMTAYIDELKNSIRCGGVYFEDIRLHNLPPVNVSATMEFLKLVPHYPSTTSNEIVDGEYVAFKEHLTTEKRMSLENTSTGDINTLEWKYVSEITGTGIPVTVHYASLSIVDAKRVIGIIKCKKGKIQKVCGMEFSGIIERDGTRVMGLTEGGASSTKILANPNMLWPIPKQWSLEDAATVPLAYSLALYCLCIRSHLYSGMRILIHSGAGALGQAVISIALAHGCEVFTTVSSLSKKTFLRELFPELREDHIGSSSNDGFSDVILALTKGQGCDIIVSNVKGELRSSTLKCCGPSGITIDTTLLHDQEDYNLGMGFMFFSRAFATVDITSIFSSEIDMKRLQLLVSDGIARGYVRPLSRITYGAHEARQALCLLAGNRHRGRVLLDLKQLTPVSQARITCSRELIQLVICDDDIFGIKFVERLISRGARTIFLQSKNSSNLLEFKACTWKQRSLDIKISYEDISDINVTRQLFKIIGNKGRIEGIYLFTNENNTANEIEPVFKRIMQHMNPFVRYSVIAMVDRKSEDRRCYVKPKLDDMPILVKLPKLKEFNDNFQLPSLSLMSIYEAIDTIEFALSSPQNSPITVSWSYKKKSLLYQILTLAGLINNTGIMYEATDSSKTLKDLGMDISIAEVIQAFLYNHYGISQLPDNILVLTVGKIVKLENELSSYAGSKDTKGLSIFMSCLYKDELEVLTKMISMPTLIRNNATRPDEFDVNQKYLFVIPGIEGHHDKFLTICERLKMSAVVLLPEFEKFETYKETAQRFVEIIPKKAIEENKRFYLLGYESGIYVALEIAAILEKQGFTGIVFCVGGSPDEICYITNIKLREFNTEKELQEAVIKHIFTLMTGKDAKELDSILGDTLTWQDKVNHCVGVLRGRVKYSHQFTRALIECTYSRITQLRNCKAMPRAIRSQLVSLRPKTLANYYAARTLQNYSQQPVVEYDIDVPFQYIIEDLQCSAIINRHLDKEILEEFENINLCETYYLNSGVSIKNV